MSKVNEQKRIWNKLLTGINQKIEKIEQIFK